MSNEPDIDPGGNLDGDELFVEQVDPSTSGEVVGRVSVAMPHYMVAEDNVWVQPLSDIIYQEDIPTSFEDIQYEDLQTVNQQILSTGEGIYLMPDEVHDFNDMTESIESLQVAAHEVVVDEMMQPQVETNEYVQSLPRQVVRGMPSYVRTVPQHQVRPAPSQIVTMPGTSRIRYLVQQAPQTYEIPQNQHVHYEMRPKAMFEGPSNQAVIPVQRPATSARSRSKSQPRRPIFGDLEDDSLAYLVQEYDEGEWDGVEMEDHEYFVGERSAILVEDDGTAGSTLPALKMQQRPYFPPNLSPTEKKEYLLVNYKKACERYFPFANIEMLNADTIYKPVEAFASDLYRFHSRGAHIHGFFRTVIDSRDPPSHDQTRYIQDIQFGKVFPLFPDYEEWDDKMRDEFRQLTSRLLRLFERKYFYANAGGGIGKAPVVKRGPKPQPKPPPDYAEQQKVRIKSVPKGFHAVRATALQPRLGQPKPISQAAVISQPIATATRLTQIPNAAPMTEPVPVPDEVGAARVEAFEHNKRADVKRMVNDAFVAREREGPHYLEYEARPSDPRTFLCRVPPGPSKTLKHQKSTGSKAMRMIHNRTIEPMIDPVSGRYVVSLDDIRGQTNTSPPEIARYIHRPVHTLREMADSARRGGPSYTTQAVVRPQGARVSRIDQAPRFTYNSSTSLSQQHQLVSSTATARAPILRNATGVSRTGVLTVNAMPPQNSANRSEHVYPRSHSSGRNPQPSTSVYRRSASSGRPVEANSSQPNDDDAEPYIQVDDDIAEHAPSMQDAMTSSMQIPSQLREKDDAALLGTSGQTRTQDSSDQNTAPATSTAKTQKRTVLLRDEKGRLRRGIKLPDGTILLRVIDDKMSGAEAKSKDPTAGGVFAMPSMSRKDEKKGGRRVEQWKRVQAPVTPWSRSPEAVVSVEAQVTDPLVKSRSRRKDFVQPEDDDDILFIGHSRQSRATKKNDNAQKRHGKRSKSEGFQTAVTQRSRSQRRTKLLSRHCPIEEAVPHRAVQLSEEKLQTYLRNRLLKQQEEDEESFYVDVVSVDSTIQDSVRELIASVPFTNGVQKHVLPEGSEAYSQQSDVDNSRERRKAGRPHKKFRGRLAKQKQAIRDAEIAEKVAIKHRELPVLDLALKVIDDPTVEVPVEAPIHLDPDVNIDTHELHEVAELLKEMVAQISLEELEPKRDVKSRSRRNWDYLPERVRSKRREYKDLNVPANERSPPPPPLKNKPRGRNSEKYRKAIALAEQQQSHENLSNVEATTISSNESSFGSHASSSTQEMQEQSHNNLGRDEQISASDFTAVFSSEQVLQAEQVPMASSTDHDTISQNLLQLESVPRGKETVASGAEESVNDEDLVDVNVDTFFSDAFNTPTSGDEEETQSQKLKKWQKCISDVTLRTPGSSPSKLKSEADRMVGERIVDASVVLPPDALRTKGASSEANLAVEALITMVSSGNTSMETEMLYRSPKETAISCEKRHADEKNPGDVCHMVETMLDVLESSFEQNDANSPVVEKGTDFFHGEDFPYFQNEVLAESSTPYVASSRSPDFDATPVSAHELGVESVAAMVEEELAKDDQHVSAIEQELIADALLFEAQGLSQQSSSFQSFATSVVVGDRLDIAADVDAVISPLCRTSDASTSRTFEIARKEWASLNAIYEENSVELTCSLNKREATESSARDLPLPWEEEDRINVHDLDISLVPMKSKETTEEDLHRTVITVPEFVSVNELWSFNFYTTDYAFEKEPHFEDPNASFCVSISEKDSDKLATVEIDLSFGREEQKCEVEKLFPCPRFEEGASESVRLNFLDLLSQDEQREIRNVVDFLVKSVELGLHGLIADSSKKSAHGEEEPPDTHPAAKFNRRRFPDEDYTKEYEVSSKRKRSAAITASQSLHLYLDDYEAEAVRRTETLDVTTLQPLPKLKIKRKRRGKKIELLRSFETAAVTAIPAEGNMLAAEVSCISEFLNSEDQEDSGFSPLTRLESSYLQSPDLFGFAEHHEKRRSRKKKEKKVLPVRGEMVTRSKAKVLTAAPSADKPRIVLRIKKSSTGPIIERVEADSDSDSSRGLFGRKLSNLNRFLKRLQFDQSFLSAKDFGYKPKSSLHSSMPHAVYPDSRVFTASRHRNHLISDFNLTMIRPMNPIVKYDADSSPLSSVRLVSPLRLSLPRAEGSLEHAVEQFEKGIGCVLEQVDNARTIIIDLKKKVHWTLHFLMDAQLFLLDVLYELWGFTARTVQIAVFSVYQTCLWEKHSELFDARMYCLLFELNAAAALSCNVDVCTSYLRRFEEWCRKSSNYTSIYNHVHGMALSMIKLISVPSVLKRLQQNTAWNSNALPSTGSEEVFSLDLVPFFQVGTCLFQDEDFDIEKVLNARMHLVNAPLETLIGYGAAQDSTRSDSFSFLFPSHTVVELCRKQIFHEIETYYRSHDMKSVLSLSNRDLYMLSPVARGYFVSRISESRAQGYLRNHVMNLEKQIEKLNGIYTDLVANVEMQNQAEFNYPCGQVVFKFYAGSVNVCVSKPTREPTLQPTAEAIEEAQRIMGSAVDNTIFHPSSVSIHPDELSLKRHRIKKSVEAVKKWVVSIQDTPIDEVDYVELQNAAPEDEPMEVVYPSSPARVQVIDDEDEDTEFGSCEALTKNCCEKGTVTTVIAGRKIQYTVDCEQGFLKMKTVDVTTNDDSTDDMTATNTFSSASFGSFDQIETLKLIRSKETGELDWMAMIQNAIEAAPPPETLPGCMLKKEAVDYKTLEIMKLHQHANHFVRETDEDGEFLDQRKEMREKIRPFQRVDYFERRRNARFEQIKSSTPLEMPRPGTGTLDQLPAYGIWIHQVMVYAELEKKRLIGLKPIDNVGRCRAARSEMIRDFAVTSKPRKRSASAVYWLGRTMREHFGDYIELGMSRLQYEKAQSGKERNEARGFGSDDVITDYFISRNNTPTTLVDPGELIENPYSFFRPTNTSRKRHPSPILLESSLVKRIPECPVLAPFGVLADEPETLYPPLDPYALTSDDDDDD